MLIYSVEEVVDNINKNPELRKYLSRLLSYYSSSHTYLMDLLDNNKTFDLIDYYLEIESKEDIECEILSELFGFSHYWGCWSFNFNNNLYFIGKN